MLSVLLQLFLRGETGQRVNAPAVAVYGKVQVCSLAALAQGRGADGADHIAGLDPVADVNGGELRKIRVHRG